MQISHELLLCGVRLNSHSVFTKCGIQTNSPLCLTKMWYCFNFPPVFTNCGVHVNSPLCFYNMCKSISTLRCLLKNVELTWAHGQLFYPQPHGSQFWLLYCNGQTQASHWRIWVFMVCLKSFPCILLSKSEDFHTVLITAHHLLLNLHQRKGNQPCARRQWLQKHPQLWSQQKRKVKRKYHLM